MAAVAAGRRRTTAAASPASLDHPAGGPRQTKRQSPTGVSPPPHHNRRQQQASNNPLKRPRPSLNDCITLCGILWCGRRCEATQWVGWTGLDWRASRLWLLLVGFEYRQTNVKHLGKIANVIVTLWLSKHKWYWLWSLYVIGQTIIRSSPRRWPSRLELRCVCPYVHKKFFRFPPNLVCG